jgi:hypothetical protein
VRATLSHSTDKCESDRFRFSSVTFSIIYLFLHSYKRLARRSDSLASTSRNSGTRARACHSITEHTIGSGFVKVPVLFSQHMFFHARRRIELHTIHSSCTHTRPSRRSRRGPRLAHRLCLAGRLLSAIHPPRRTTHSILTPLELEDGRSYDSDHA